MQSMEELQNNIEGIEDLQSIVKTMKALAATSIKQYEKAVESLNEYKRTIDMGMQVVFKKSSDSIHIKPPLEDMEIHVVFGSDQGLAGRFNERIVEYFSNETGRGVLDKNRSFLFCVGQQAVSRLEEKNMEIEGVFSLPYTISGITDKVLQVLLKIDELRGGFKGTPQVILYFNIPVSGVGFTSGKVKLMPPDIESIYDKSKRWPSRCIPTFTMEWEKLFSSLLRHHFFITLYRAFALSLAAENSSRLSSMQAAEKNIDEKLEELKGDFRRKRQNSITEELNDVVSGFKALSKSRKGDSYSA